MSAKNDVGKPAAACRMNAPIGHFDEKWALQKLASTLNRSQIMPTASAGSATISGIFDSIRYTQKGSKN
jgi:hypothetical protein